jgi:hypothetical protein
VIEIEDERILSWSSDFALYIWNKNGELAGIIENQHDEKDIKSKCDKYKIRPADMDKVIEMQSQISIKNIKKPESSGHIKGNKYIKVRKNNSGKLEKIYWNFEAEITTSMEYDQDRTILGLASGEVVIIKIF